MMILNMWRLINLNCTIIYFKVLRLALFLFSLTTDTRNRSSLEQGYREVAFNFGYYRFDRIITGPKYNLPMLNGASPIARGKSMRYSD
jgi:hypothetical protein